MNPAAEVFAACGLPTRQTAQRLMTFGVEIGVFELFQLIGLAKVRLLPGNLFDIDPAGIDAFITPIRGFGDGEYEHSNPPAVVLNGDIIDLAVWHPAAPGRWALLTGAARVLGSIEPQLLLPPPVPISRDILSWMRCRRQGLVLLTRDELEVGHILRTIDTIVAEDATHQAELKRLASQPWPAPNVIARRVA